MVIGCTLVSVGTNYLILKLLLSRTGVGETQRPWVLFRTGCRLGLYPDDLTKLGQGVT